MGASVPTSQPIVQLDDHACPRLSESLGRWLAPPFPWAAFTFGLLVAAGWMKTAPFIAVDSLEYRAMALGRFNEVLGSISGRVLHPAFVRLLSFALSMNIDRAFFIVALASLATFIWTVAWLLRQAVGCAALVLPLLFTPLVVEEMFRLYYCQELFYAALLGCFFVALCKGCKQVALIILFALFLTRESTILLALVWATIAWSESDFQLVGGCIGATLAGVVCSRMFAALGQPNLHHVNELAYLALKPPFDTLRNLFGVVLVPPEMQGQPGFTCVPFLTIRFPHLFSYGLIKQCGICRPDLHIPLHTMILSLSLFGIGPAVLWSIFRSDSLSTLPITTRWLKVAGISGLLFFLAAPEVSLWLERDLSYAWPLFWLAIPAFLPMIRPFSVTITAVLLLENSVASWIPYLLVKLQPDTWRFSLLALCFAVAMQAVALLSLRRQQSVRSQKWRPDKQALFPGFWKG